LPVSEGLLEALSFPRGEVLEVLPQPHRNLDLGEFRIFNQPESLDPGETPKLVLDPLDSPPALIELSLSIDGSVVT